MNLQSARGCVRGWARSREIDTLILVVTTSQRKNSNLKLIRELDWLYDKSTIDLHSHGGIVRSSIYLRSSGLADDISLAVVQSGESHRSPFAAFTSLRTMPASCSRNTSLEQHKSRRGVLAPEGALNHALNYIFKLDHAIPILRLPFQQ